MIIITIAIIIMIQRKLTYKCRNSTHRTTRRAVYSMLGKCRRFDLPLDLQLELFHAMALTIVTIGCEVGGL